MPQGVQPTRIEQPFAILAPWSISREAVVIPLHCRGQNRRSDGHAELIVPAEIRCEERYVYRESRVHHLVS